MRKRKSLFTFFFVFILMLSLTTVSASSKTVEDLKEKTDSLIDSLPQSAKDDLSSIGVDSVDTSTLNKVSFSSIMKLIADKLKQQSTAPVSAGAVVIAILILNALIESYKDGIKNTSIREVMSVVSTLCITATLVVPVIDLINYSAATVLDASNFMLIYIPVMLSILAFSGKIVSSAGYYSMMIMVCQAVTQLSSRFITPMLSVYLGICVSSSITDRLNLTGFCNMLSKIIKWLIAFIMTVFSAMLTIRGMITTAYDSVTARAVRFTMSSFIPIVGAALSESYKTIQGSINLLRTGAGVFVILAICIVFLPVIARCLMWLLSVNLCKSVAQVMGVSTPQNLLESVSSVISTVFAVTVCVTAVFIISTALLITLGGT